MAETLIALDALTRQFGAVTAVDQVTLAVHRGEVLGLLGPNGAGKSTTMKMLAGFLTPSGGRAAIAGHDVETHPLAAKRALGYLPEGAPSYSDMTAAGFLHFIAGMRGFSGVERRRRIDMAAIRANLAGVMHQPIETLSKGYKRRVGLAQALLHDPPVLVLDEPTDGLDPNQKHEVRELIRAMAPDKAIMISTHLLEEVEAVCSRAVIIARGRIVADGKPADLAARDPMHHRIIVALPPGQIAAARAKLAQLPDVHAVGAWAEGEERGLYVQPEPGRNLLTAIAALGRAEGWDIEELKIEHGKLEGVFRAITRAMPQPGPGQTRIETAE